MAFLDTKYQRKSMAITVALHLVLLLFLLLFGFSYIDPPLEKGIAVNFGTSSTGFGKQQPTQPVKSAPVEKSTPTPSPESNQETPVVADEIATQETEEAPVIKEEKKKTTPEKKQEEEKKKTEKVQPKPDQATSDALNNLLNTTGKSSQGEGNDNTGGDKGDPDGTIDANSYYGSGKGLDGDGNYRLGGRKALVKKTFVQDCNQSGVVVVKIEVNRHGQVIKAIPGVKGTTNSDPCLTQPAKRAALATKFNSDPNAPIKQVGKIIYEFKISD